MFQKDGMKCLEGYHILPINLSAYIIIYGVKVRLSQKQISVTATM